MYDGEIPERTLINCVKLSKSKRWILYLKSYIR